MVQVRRGRKPDSFLFGQDGRSYRRSCDLLFDDRCDISGLVVQMKKGANNMNYQFNQANYGVEYMYSDDGTKIMVLVINGGFHLFASSMEFCKLAFDKRFIQFYLGNKDRLTDQELDGDEFSYEHVVNDFKDFFVSLGYDEIDEIDLSYIIFNLDIEEVPVGVPFQIDYTCDYESGDYTEFVRVFRPEEWEIIPERSDI